MMSFIKKPIFYSNIQKTIIVSLLALFCGSLLYSQSTNQEQVKRLQRAIFIYNFAQQVNWQNQESTSFFKIGVLGPDRTTIDLKSLSKNRKIKNKPVQVIRFNAVKDVKDVHLLYVNKSFNFDINYILNKIEGKNILLITEDYNYNTSMINMVNVGNSFAYEINTSLLERENLAAANSLKQYAVSNSEKWKELYQTSEAKLDETKEIKQQQQDIIKQKEKEIFSQKEKITAQESAIDTILNASVKKDKWIKTLSNLSELQQRKFEDKVKIERALEDNIKQQIEFIKSQEEKIATSNLEIKKQLNYIEEQNLEIEKKEAVLKAQQSKINTQSTVNSLLILIIVLVLIGALLIFRGFIAKKKLNKALALKNEAIKIQAFELENKNRELEQFAYIASHDLKEPLITISSLIDLLVEDYEDKFDEEGKMSLNFIQESSVRMKDLIDAILAYSRLGKSKEYTSINCNTVIDTLKGDLQNVISRTNSKIIVDTLPIINGAELEIRLLFQNLISNGIKFTIPEVSPVINVTAIKTNSNNTEYWQFAIKDNGIGIPEKHQERIFSIFQRLHTRDEYEGTGIGLAHCKKIVESHGGKIWLTSEENKGTTFFFSIPI